MALTYKVVDSIKAGSRLPNLMSSNFDESVVDFKAFLVKNGFPSDVVWITPSDILVGNRPLVYVRVPVPKENEQDARRLFELGLKEQKGVLVETVCESEASTFAFVWVPSNESEAEEYQMPKGLKMGVRVGTSRLPAKMVKSRLRWLYLSIRFRKAQSTKELLFH